MCLELSAGMEAYDGVEREDRGAYPSKCSAVGSHGKIWKSNDPDYTVVFKNITLATVMKKVG